jgi:hypothetical protein
MRSILSKFAKKRAERKLEEELKDLRPGDEEPSDPLPSDPTPPTIPNIHPQQWQQSQDDRSIDDSPDFLTSTDEDDDTESIESETLLEKVQLARADRLRPIKKRRNIEIVGGGLIPGKTNLAQGPKFDRKDIEFSQQPPKAYAYLEESLASRSDEWIPGEELSLEQYKQIRDQAKLDRYRRFLSSRVYHPPYDQTSPPSAHIEDTMVTPLEYQGYCEHTLPLA